MRRTAPAPPPPPTMMMVMSGGGKGGGGDDGGVGGGEGETQAGLAHTRRQLLCVEEPTPGLK